MIGMVQGRKFHPRQISTFYSPTHAQTKLQFHTCIFITPYFPWYKSMIIAGARHYFAPRVFIVGLYSDFVCWRSILSPDKWNWVKRSVQSFMNINVPTPPNYEKHMLNLAFIQYLFTEGEHEDAPTEIQSKERALFRQCQVYWKGWWMLRPTAELTSTKLCGWSTGRNVDCLKCREHCHVVSSKLMTSAALRKQLILCTPWCWCARRQRERTRKRCLWGLPSCTLSHDASSLWLDAGWHCQILYKC